MMAGCATAPPPAEVPEGSEASGAAVVNPGVIRWLGQVVLSLIQSVKVNVEVKHETEK